MLVCALDAECRSTVNTFVWILRRYSRVHVSIECTIATSLWSKGPEQTVIRAWSGFVVNRKGLDWAMRNKREIGNSVASQVWASIALHHDISHDGHGG